MQAKIIHITLTDPHICLEERVTQNMPKMTLNTIKKITFINSNCMENTIKEVQMCR